MPLSLALAAPREAGAAAAQTGAPQQSVVQALTEAFGHRSYVLLVLGFFTCGFQIFFIAVHLPAYLVDRGLPAEIGGWAIAIIGLFNIVGAISAGWLANLMPKRYILSFIYFGRAVAILVYIMLPPSAVATLVFGAVLGLLWLSTVPPTSGLVAVMFGTRWLAMLFGFAFFSHQVGGFLGVWLGGVLFERTGSYDAVWWLSILLGLLVGGDQSADRGEAGRTRPLPRRPDDGAEQPVQQDNTPGAVRPCPPSAVVSLAHARGHRRLRLPHLHDRLRAALDARLLPHADVARPTAGDARCSRSRSRSRRCSTAPPSRSPARSPTASARSA